MTIFESGSFDQPKNVGKCKERVPNAVKNDREKYRSTLSNKASPEKEGFVPADYHQHILQYKTKKIKYVTKLFGISHR